MFTIGQFDIELDNWYTIILREKICNANSLIKNIQVFDPAQTTTSSRQTIETRLAISDSYKGNTIMSCKCSNKYIYET